MAILWMAGAAKCGRTSSYREPLSQRLTGLFIKMAVKEKRARCPRPLAVARVNVRFGSKPDIAVSLANVRFTPESGHQLWFSA